MNIATLIASTELSRGDVRAGGDALAAAALEPTGETWIEAERACDLHFAGSRTAARAVLEGLLPGIDVVVQPAAGRAKRLLVADMDSTMITVECVDELADYAGVKREVAAITEAAMQGELDFAGALRARVALLAGLDETVIAECLRERVRATSGAGTLVATMRAHGAETLLISGGFTAFARPVASALGFDRSIANVLEVEDGRLTGAVVPPIVDGARKASALVDARKRLGLDPHDVLAIGDGANDLAMIEAAGLGVSYRGKPLLTERADAAIFFGDLTVLLHAQGYARKSWVG